MSGLNVIPIFPVPVFISTDEFPLDEDELDFINHLDLRVNEHGNLMSKDGYVLKNAELSRLRNFLEDNLEQYVRKVLLVKKEIKFRITQSWVNESSKGMCHRNHSHNNSVISGVFYIAGDKCPIVFDNNRTPRLGAFDVAFEYDEYNIFNSQTWWLENEKNKLILFPSSLPHSVGENESDTKRISLSFNTFVSGTLGNGPDRAELIL